MVERARQGDFIYGSAYGGARMRSCPRWIRQRLKTMKLGSVTDISKLR